MMYPEQIKHLDTIFQYQIRIHFLTETRHLVYIDDDDIVQKQIFDASHDIQN